MTTQFVLHTDSKSLGTPAYAKHMRVVPSTRICFAYADLYGKFIQVPEGLPGWDLCQCGSKPTSHIPRILIPLAYAWYMRQICVAYADFPTPRICVEYADFWLSHMLRICDRFPPPTRRLIRLQAVKSSDLAYASSAVNSVTGG